MDEVRLCYSGHALLPQAVQARHEASSLAIYAAQPTACHPTSDLDQKDESGSTATAPPGSSQANSDFGGAGIACNEANSVGCCYYVCNAPMCPGVFLQGRGAGWQGRNL